MKIFIFLLLPAIFGINLNGQSLINLDPTAIISDPINFSINPYNYIFFNSYDNSSFKSDNSSFKQISREEITNYVNNKYENGETILKKLDSDNVLNITLDNNNFTIIKLSKNNYRLFRFFKENQSYLLICRMNVDICECGSEMKLFNKGTKKLISLERTFTFSIKKDVFHRLKKFNFIDDFPTDLNDYCTFLIDLDKGN